MLFRGFWDDLKSPIIGLSPMDGVTDAAFRYMVAKYSKPDVIMTEFTNVEGLARGAVKMLVAFEYSEIERPVVAQIYGVEEDSYYKVCFMLCELGFDGIDINMGCPANKVARRGSGAGLIKHPEHAKKLIRTCKQAVKDWSEGRTMEDIGLRPKIIKAVNERKKQKAERRQIPISVKTRIGFDEIVTEEWINTLLDEQPANISLHGRTLKQMYLGQADWEELAKAAEICKKAGVTLLGNGDILSLNDVDYRVKNYTPDGVLVGRATFGNPWFFSGHQPTEEERIKAAIEHSQVFEKLLPDLAFVNMRKHLGWYCKGFEGARELRSKLMQTHSSEEVISIFEEHFGKILA